MRLFTLDHLKQESPNIEFAPSKWSALVIGSVAAALALGAAAAALGIIPHGIIPSFFLWIVTLFFSMAATMGVVGFRQISRGKPWRCRCRDSTLWICCSPRWSSGSELNALVLELDRSELVWVEPVKLTFIFKAPRSSEWKFYRFLDVGLTDAAAQTLEHFANDQRIAAEIREQIAPQSGVYNQPARRLRPGVIRVNWDGISPGLKAAGKYFSFWTELRPLRRERITND